MNALEHFIRENGLDEAQAMDYLMALNLISDNCVCASDVADCDCHWAVYKLQKYKQQIQTTP